MEVVQKPIDANHVSFQELRSKFSSIVGSKEDHLLALEFLSSTLVSLAKYLPQDEVKHLQECLLTWTSNSKSVLNALNITEKRLVATEKCFKYRDEIEVLNEHIVI
uniref:Uncharacterized protein n=1 Tax=Ciona intestinalis TaxID=7719 RepID=H2XXB9_CIOIN